MEPFQNFYRRERTPFYAYLVRRTGDPSLASDILQESFTRLYASYPAERWNARLLYAIGRNLLIDARRRRKREADPPPEEAQADDAEERLLARDETRRVLAALQRLDEEDRDLLALVASGGLSYREIAALTGWSEANVRVKIHRARCRLRNLLDAEKP